MRHLFLAAVVLGLSASLSCGAAQKNPVVVFETSMGTFEVEVYQDKSPITAENFLQYVKDKFYDGTIFHRVIGQPGSPKDFMIQGGGFGTDRNMKETRAPIKNESGNGVKNVTYAIAMARTAALDSATSQFYINVADNAFLDENKYCAFGMVVSGREVIDKIKSVAVHPRGNDRLSEAEPEEQIVIKSARIKE